MVLNIAVMGTGEDEVEGIYFCSHYIVIYPTNSLSTLHSQVVLSVFIQNLLCNAMQS